MGKMQNIEPIKPLADELPSVYADRLGLQYSSIVTQYHKKENGQFFTPTQIANFMASMVRSDASKIRILDPGCGTAILTCSLAERLVDINTDLETIEFVVYETDYNLIPFCEASIKYLKKWLNKKDISSSYSLETEDFVLSNGHTLNANDLFNTTIEPFDIIISNPPYFKLSKDDARTKAAITVVNGQPNIYSFFMAICAKLLKVNGELIFITPRSFTSGGYFRVFREFFFDLIQLEKIHLFVSRRDTFNRDSVLQETMILKGIRCPIIQDNANVTISSSHGLKDIDHPANKVFQQKDLIDLRSKEKILHLPINDFEEQILDVFKGWNGTLNKYNIQISTGPVVAFRALDYIYEKYENSTVFLAPLFWLHNIGKMSLTWPLPKEGKGQYVRVLEESRSILIPNKNYVFLRRFSTKDDKSRLIAAPYFSNAIDAEFIGVENKVNYIYRPNGHLDRNELIGLCALLNSELFDFFFRMFNGNVNVSATELREITLPPLDRIKEIGDSVILSNDYSVENINKIVNELFELTAILSLNE
jgi:adenine-specific DNA-methyltransferase